MLIIRAMMKMRILIMLLVICVVLICGCIEDKQETISTTSSTLPSLAESNECIDLRENSEERNKCFYRLALDRKDVSLCNEISLTLLNPDIKSEGNKSIMTPTGGVGPEGPIPVHVPHRAQCQKDIAILIEDPRICDDIKTYSNIKKECYFELANQLGDTSLCDKLPEEKVIAGKTRSECYDAVSKYFNQSKLKEFSTGTRCDKIVYPDTRDKCYYDIAPVKKDQSICENIQAEHIRDWCYIRVARAKEDPDICERVTEPRGNRRKCYVSLAKELQNPDICERIRKKVNKDMCFSEIAKIKQDASICDRISDRYTKNGCVNSVKAK